MNYLEWHSAFNFQVAELNYFSVHHKKLVAKLAKPL